MHTPVNGIESKNVVAVRRDGHSLAPVAKLVDARHLGCRVSTAWGFESLQAHKWFNVNGLSAKRASVRPSPLSNGKTTPPFCFANPL